MADQVGKTTGIPNFNLVGTMPMAGNSGKLYRGGHPSGQALQTLVQLGVAQIVKVSKDDSSTPLADEQAGFAASQVWQAPDWKLIGVIAWLRLCVNQIAMVLGGGQNAFVHCSSGERRSSMVCAAFRVMCCGWSVDAALAEIKDTGWSSVFTAPAGASEALFPNEPEKWEEWLAYYLRRVGVWKPATDQQIAQTVISDDDGFVPAPTEVEA